MNKVLKGCIFDLDGVLVDTARYHFLAWKRLAEEPGFEFTEKDNEHLKGASRMTSLEIMLASANLSFARHEKDNLAAIKAGMVCVGIGNPDTLYIADIVIPGLYKIGYDELIKILS